MPNLKVTLYIRIMTPEGKRKMCKPVYASRGRLKPLHAEGFGHQPDGEYYLRHAGKWEAVGNDPYVALDQLADKQRELRCTANAVPNSPPAAVTQLSALLKQKLATLPDEALGKLMFDVVWNVMDVLSPEMAICQEATERLLGHEARDQMMTKVWEREVFVGSLKDAEELVGANSMKIASVLSLCSEEIERKNPTIHYTRVSILDAHPISTRQFEEIIGAIDHGLRRGNLLIHCAAGYSRSPIMAAAWMHRRGYLNFEVALQEIGRLRPAIDPSPVLIKSIKEELSR